MVPNGWEVKKLESLASVERGKFSARPRNDPKYYGGEIPFVQTGDIAGSKTYLKSYSQTLNEEGLKVSRLFPKNTILITIAANIGDVAITSFDVACPDSLVAIQAKESMDVVWLYFYLETCQQELDGQATQNAQKNINLQVLRPLKILTPPLPEQQKIANILSTWDKAIGTTERLIDNSTQQKKALMQQLLTGKKRLLDESGKRFESEWEKYPVGDICQSIVPGRNKPKEFDGNIPWVTTPEFQGRYIPSKLQKNYISQSVIDECGAKLVPEGAVVIAAVGDLGLTAIASEIVVLNQQLHAFVCGENVHNEYLFYWLSYQKPYMESIASKTTIQYMNKKNCESIPVKLPTLEEQQKIATVLTNADKEIELLEQQLADLQQEKKALMQVLLTGKKRVLVKRKVA